jgi:hypothetical protein
MTNRSANIRESLARYFGLSENNAKEGGFSPREEDHYPWVAARTVLILIPAFVMGRILNLEANLTGVLGMLGLVLAFATVIGVLQRLLAK